MHKATTASNGGALGYMEMSYGGECSVASYHISKEWLELYQYSSQFYYCLCKFTYFVDDFSN